MPEKLTARDIDVVDGDVVVSVPGDGTLLIAGEEVVKLAIGKGQPVQEANEEDYEEQDGQKYK
jgi:hypothetical protein